MSNQNSSIKIIDIDHLEKNDVQLIVSPKRRTEILTKIGYASNKEGDLIDAITHDKVCTEDNTPINLKKMKKLALIGGSHVFVKNIAGYSQVLAKKKEIKFINPQSS